LRIPLLEQTPHFPCPYLLITLGGSELNTDHHFIEGRCHEVRKMFWSC